MTISESEKLLDLAQKLRKIAHPIGPLHAYWDLIFDLEAFANGERTLLRMSYEEWIEFAEGVISENPKFDAIPPSHPS